MEVDKRKMYFSTHKILRLHRYKEIFKGIASEFKEKYVKYEEEKGEGEKNSNKKNYRFINF